MIRFFVNERQSLPGTARWERLYYEVRFYFIRLVVTLQYLGVGRLAVIVEPVEVEAAIEII